MFIELKGYGGFRVVLDVAKISLYGLDPGPKLFVRCDGQEISITENVESQFELVKNSISEFNGDIRKIEGIR
jgi:hypothetical protein